MNAKEGLPHWRRSVVAFAIGATAAFAPAVETFINRGTAAAFAPAVDTAFAADRGVGPSLQAELEGLKASLSPVEINYHVGSQEVPFTPDNWWRLLGQEEGAMFPVMVDSLVEANSRDMGYNVLEFGPGVTSAVTTALNLGIANYYGAYRPLVVGMDREHEPAIHVLPKYADKYLDIYRQAMSNGLAISGKGNVNHLAETTLFDKVVMVAPFPTRYGLNNVLNAAFNRVKPEGYFVFIPDPDAVDPYSQRDLKQFENNLIQLGYPPDEFKPLLLSPEQIDMINVGDLTTVTDEVRERIIAARGLCSLVSAHIQWSPEDDPDDLYHKKIKVYLIRKLKSPATEQARRSDEREMELPDLDPRLSGPLLLALLTALAGAGGLRAIGRGGRGATV